MKISIWCFLKVHWFGRHFLEGRVQSLVVKAMKVLYDTIAGFYGRAVIYIGVWVIYTSLFYVTITI